MTGQKPQRRLPCRDEYKMTVDYDNLHEKWDTIHQEFGAPTYQLRRKLILTLISDLFRKQLDLTGKRLSVLDVGCGTGDYSLVLANNGFKVTGFDFSEYAIKTAKDRCAGSPGNPPEFIVGDINTFTTNEKYDLIIMSEVLEHIEEDTGILHKYRDFLKDDGYVLISVPFDPAFWSVEDEQSGHVRRYDNPMIDALFSDADLQIMKRVWIGFPTITLMWMVKRKILRFFTFINNPKRGTASSKIIRFFSGILVRIDSQFSFVKKGVGIIVLAKK